MRRRYLEHYIYADDATEEVGLLVRLRLPWLLVGLGVGAIITLVVSQFEKVLANQVSLAFFIPIIVYMSDAVGTQTETIYIRNLSRHREKIKLSVYLIKELLLGLIIGSASGLLLGLFAMIWLDSPTIALTVGLAMLGSITTAALLALLIPTLLQRFKKVDPAVGAGPFTTAIQDLVSLVIYFAIASVIIL